MEYETQQYNFNRILNYSHKEVDNLFNLKYFVVEKKNNSNQGNKIKMTNPFEYQQKQKKQKKNKIKSSIDQEQLEELKKYSKVNLKKMKKMSNREEGLDEYQNNVFKQSRQNKKSRKRGTMYQIPEQFKCKRSRSIANQELRGRKPLYDKPKKIIYEPYLELGQIEKSRQKSQNIYFKGTIDCDQRLKWFVKIFSKEVDGALVAQGPNRNRSIHGDQVYFTLEKNQLEGGKKQCKIVYIIPYEQVKGKKRQIVGKIELVKSKNIYVLNPINKRITSFNIRINQVNKQWILQRDKKYFLAVFQTWPSTSEYPECIITKEFGQFGKVQIETGALLKMNAVYQEQYTQEQIQQGLSKFLKSVDLKGQYLIPAQQIANRKDLRLQNIFTIDPLTARDFDDALSIKKLTIEEKNVYGQQYKSKDIYQIGVHIADASYFVQECGIIDQQAQIRTTSVYLVHRVIPMLPRILCETMCSLNPGLERLTLSVWFNVDSDGNVFQGSKYDKTVIKSKARFTYQQAQKIIQKKVNSQKQMQQGFGCILQQDFQVIAQSIRLMNLLSVKIRNKRIQSGSLSFEVPKKSFQLDKDYYPISYQIQQRVQAHFLVEQYMLLGNKKVAQILVKNMGKYALLRRHPFPGDKKRQKFETFLKKIGQDLKIKRQTNIQQQVNKMLQKNIRQSVKDIIKYQLIFLLELADYFLVGEVKQSDWIHYALNMKMYTHFTSPIRRYPDIIVHRQLSAIIQQEKQGLKTPRIPYGQNLSKLIQRCNKNKSSAKKVSTDCQKIFLCLYLKNNPVIASGILTSINEWGFKISIPHYDFRTTIQIKGIKKVKVLKLDTDSSGRKYITLQYSINDNQKFTVILKQIQQVKVRLESTDTFPIDYKIKLIMPHPKIVGETLVIE